MPQSRHRKLNKAKKRPRVPSANPTTVTSAGRAAGNRNTRIGAIIVVAVLAVAAIAFVVSRRGTPAAAEIVTTQSGLRIQDLRVGDGPSPGPTQTVKVHYIGRLENGQEFNNSYKDGRPVEFAVNGVIPGWTEGLQSMKVGGKRRLLIPSKLAYGAAGRPPTIPPNSNLEFEIELLEVKSTPPSPNFR